MKTTSFPIHPTQHADFQDLRKTLVLVRGIHTVDIHPDHIDVTYDPAETDLGRVRGLIEHKGYATDAPPAAEEP
ncbi:MAG TPA: hypothetical protein V6D05_10325 [Stenomitos sp.]